MSAEGAGFSIDPAAVREWKRYPEYKDSGVEWLGEVPEGWEVKRLKYGVILKSKRVSGRETNLPYIGLENIESWTGKLIQSEEPMISDGQSTLFDPGDVLFGKLRPYLAKVIQAQASGICSSELLVLRSVDVTPDFLVNSILNRDFIQTVDASTYGTKMPRANWEFIGNLPILVPPLLEQHAIAAFLDRETARIDALIEKKQRFIELLEEKRQALITQAVTKGLDPDVEMKDSGVEWLGEVPAEWGVKRLKYGVTLKSERVSGREVNLPYIGLENIESWTGKLVQSEEPMISDGQSTLFDPGDILFGKLRPYLAKVIQAQASGICSSELLVLRSVDVTPDFLVNSILNRDFIQTVDASTYGTKMPRANWEFIGNLPILVPPLSEQHAIAAFLDRETTQVDALIHILTQQIEKLHEYRTALISAAVTGKIDVRGEVEVA